MKKQVLGLAVSLLVALFSCLTSHASTITVDGNFSDWSGITALGTDASGDASGGIVDWTSLWATNSSGNLYLSYSTVSNIDFASNAWRYAIYIDKDNNPSTGFKGMDGSFLIGAEYLIEGGSLHQYNGTGTSWSWLWLSSLSYSVTANRVEMAIPESNLGICANYAIKIMLLGANPVTADYAKDDKSGYAYSSVIDRFEYATDQELNSVYTIECDPATTMSASSEATLHFQGDYSAKLTYSLGSLWSSVKLIRYFPVPENWGDDKNISLWVRGYSGCTENLLVYIVESDRDEWVYQNSAALINETWTKIVIPLSDLWDNPWDGNLGDGVKTLTDVIGYKIVIQDITDDGTSPINSSIYLDEFIRDDGLPSAPHLIPAVDNYACYYGGSRINDLSKFDLIIINSDSYTPDEIAQMRVAGTIIIGYVSLGEDVRPLQVGDGKGPISSGVLTYKGYASYYLDDNPKDGCPDQNQIWGGYFINAGNKDWQDYLINTLADQILNVKGCDGIFMDTVGIVEDPRYAWTSPGMISIIAAIRKAYPNKYLIANGGFTAIFDDLEKYVNALMFESLTSTYDFYSGSYTKWDQYGLDYTAVLANQINAVRAYPDNTTINVFSLDYCESDDAILYADDYNRAESFGFVPSIGDIYLSKIYMVNPVNNFKAVAVKIGTKRKVNLTWQAPCEYVTDSNVLKFILKRSTAGPIITDEEWNNAYTLSSNISPSATIFVDKYPPIGTNVYYAIGAVKEGGTSLAGRPAASCFVK